VFLFPSLQSLDRDSWLHCRHTPLLSATQHVVLPSHTRGARPCTSELHRPDNISKTLDNQAVISAGVWSTTKVYDPISVERIWVAFLLDVVADFGAGVRDTPLLYSTKSSAFCATIRQFLRTRHAANDSHTSMLQSVPQYY
jgi:hypothetical protein